MLTPLLNGLRPPGESGPDGSNVGCALGGQPDHSTAQRGVAAGGLVRVLVVVLEALLVDVRVGVSVIAVAVLVLVLDVLVVVLAVGVLVLHVAMRVLVAVGMVVRMLVGMLVRAHAASSSRFARLGVALVLLLGTARAQAADREVGEARAVSESIADLLAHGVRAAPGRPRSRGRSARRPGTRARRAR